MLVIPYRAHILNKQTNKINPVDHIATHKTVPQVHRHYFISVNLRKVYQC